MIDIIIPLYNERENILHFEETLFSKLCTIESEYGVLFHVIFVNDGSTDDSAPLLSRFTTVTKIPVSVASYPKNMGMGYAIQHGFAFAHSRFIITMDGDLSYRPEDIVKLITTQREGDFDCVSGSPYAGSDLVEDVQLHRWIISYINSLLYRAVMGVTCVTGLFRIYKREVIADLPLEDNGFGIQTEIMYHLLKNKKKVKEIPVMLHTRQRGKSKMTIWKETLNSITFLARICLTRVRLL